MPDIDVPCATCETIIRAHVAMPHIVNMFSATMIVVEHPTPERCPVCKTLLVVTVEAVPNLLLSMREPDEGANYIRTTTTPIQ